jgi:hypothetical protein
MKLPVLMDSRPPLVQVVLIVVPALVFGVFTGIALDLAAAAYYVMLGLALVGGILAGLEHDGGGHGAQRGLTGGVLFGAGVLLGHHLLSRRATTPLPHPEAVELIISGLFGALLGSIGGVLRGAQEHAAREAAADALEAGWRPQGTVRSP